VRYLIVGLVLTVYVVINLVLPYTIFGLANYIAQSLCWVLLAVAALKVSRFKNVRILRPNTSITIMAATIAVFQIVTLIFTGIFTSFGKSPYQTTPLFILINTTFFMSAIIGAELSRAYLVKTGSRRYSTLTLGLTALLYAAILIPLARYETLSLSSPLQLTEFLGSTFLPLLAESLLASYIAYIAGAIPAIAYFGILQGFQWLSPILPNPSWSIKALVGVMVPTIGFLTIQQSTMPQMMKKHGRQIRVKKPILGWTIVATICVLAVWGSTGLLGFRPSVIGSGSMSPTMNVGDITISVSTPPEAIKIGDIIQYQTADAQITHRVISTYTSAGSRWFITQGDANNASDDPINERQIIGKIVFTIPQLGWVSIALKEFAAKTYTFFTTTLPQTLTNTWTWIVTNGVYITSALTFTAYSYLLLTYKAIKKEEKT